ncbi:hypothetical protein NCC78_14030 [Micromonospora phytophila]|uniref:hypothetical protein n=1 Tax=Micromonospora phytophila TaxID=709888 RepID=UPI00202DB79C|nr:hypothetical protein [Micromonospora phytophila]MCM0675799.1 hypothetical protein [Micromonospora phytophila]
MIAALARIAPLDGNCEHSEVELRGQLRARAGKDRRINHLQIRAGPAGFDIIAFVTADNSLAAHSILHGLVQELIVDDPRLRLWRVI